MTRKERRFLVSFLPSNRTGRRLSFAPVQLWRKDRLKKVFDPFIDLSVWKDRIRCTNFIATFIWLEAIKGASSGRNEF